MGVNVQKLVVKLVKQIAMKNNTIAFIEKVGNSFVHTGITKELQQIIGVPREFVVNKTLAQVHTDNMVQILRPEYEKAWNGRDALFKVENVLNAEFPLCGAISPILLYGKVVRTIVYIVPLKEIPKLLQDIA